MTVLAAILLMAKCQTTDHVQKVDEIQELVAVLQSKMVVNGSWICPTFAREMNLQAEKVVSQMSMTIMCKTANAKLDRDADIKRNECCAAFSVICE
jgi:hypothetical protein